MGMFDYINFEMTCPSCGAVVKGFQSKDSYCQLELIDPTEVETMYSICNNCENTLRLSRSRPEPPKARDKPFNLEEVEALGFTLS